MNAVIFAYNRPKLLFDLVNKIIEFKRYDSDTQETKFFSKVFIVQDGIRSTEKGARRENYHTLTELSCELELSDPRISRVAFENNVGLTRNTLRTIRLLKQECNQSIYFEEDKFPTLLGLDFLAKHAPSMDPYTYLDTAPLNIHKRVNQTSISTLFTDNGNHIYGEHLIRTVEELLVAKDRYKEEFERNLYRYLSSFLSGFALKRAYDYYSSYLSWGLTNPDRPDSLFAYALILKKKLKVCPIMPLTDNRSDQDGGGINVNTVPENRSFECTNSLKHIWGQLVCPKCERFGASERVALGKIEVVRAGLYFRKQQFISKIKNKNK